MQYRNGWSQLWSREIAFPVERLYNLIQTGQWTDPDSEQKWTEMYPEPYQLWSDDPATDGVLTLQDVTLQCPWCSKLLTIEINEFRIMHVKKKPYCRCDTCHSPTHSRLFNADTLSAQYFRNDVRRFQSNPDGWYAILRLL